jgi:cation:H+ antiporter
MATASILAGLALLYGGGESLVRGGSGLALRLGISPLVVGLTVVAFGTSSPELLVAVRASLDGSSGIALGNVMGSNIMNIALILGTAALVKPLPVNAKIIRRETPVMIGATLIVSALLLLGGVGRWEGGVLASAVVVYTAFNVIVARRVSAAAVRREYAEGLPRAGGGFFILFILVVLGLALLSFGAELLVHGSVFVARHFGMSQVTIGLTVVAVGTSLPELAICLVAAFRGEADLAVGNIVGSNIFNATAIIGTSALIAPISSRGVTPADLVAFAASSLLILPVMARGRKITRMEGGILVSAYAAYLIWLLG